MKNKKIILTIFSIAFLACYSEVNAIDSLNGIIPEERIIDWSQVGVEGGIPARNTLCATLSSGGGDDASLIQNALNNCPANQVVYLNAGNYYIKSTIKIPSNVTLRGSGAAKTIIHTDVSMNSLIRIGSGYTDAGWSTISNIESGYAKGSTQINLTNASSFNAGDFIIIDELNDASIPVVAAGGAYYGVFPGGSDRNFAVIHKVVEKSGNSLKINPPAVYSFKSALNPRAIKSSFVTYTQFAGIEDVAVKNDLVGSPDSQGRYLNGSSNINVMFQGAANSWIKNVKIENCGKRCVDMYLDGFRNEVRDSLISNCLNRWDSDTCYGTNMMMSSFNLIENNIYDRTAEAFMTSSAVGNVYGYNFEYDVHRTANLGWDWMGDWTHGTHSAFNLLEGNLGVGIKWDFIHGSGSHNTSFRNRYTSKHDLIDGSMAVGAVITEVNNHYINTIGNILGVAGWNNVYEVLNPSGNIYDSQKPIHATGVPSSSVVSDSAAFSTTLRHMNYDYVTKSVKHCNDSGEPGCQGGSGSTSIPRSLYLSEKPSWFGSAVWPPVDPVTATVNDIPAKIRFETGSNPTPTCSDNIQNQNETGIDCGGVCPACQIAPPAPTTYNLTNFISLVQNWLGIGNSTSDVNNDGIVNTRDLGIIMSNWAN